MKNIERRAVVVRLLALVLAAGLTVFVIRWCVNGGDWASSAFNRHLYTASGELASGTVLDRDGDVLSAVVNGRRTYYDNKTVRKATLHVVGDLQGNIGTGALNAFADKLTGYSLLGGAFGAQRGSSLTLTIDAYYNYVAYQALGGKAGTVAVYNYKTGEILCLVSAPSYDPLHVPSDLTTSDAYKGAYLNRFLSSAFTPGSVFKTVTAAAALEQIPDLKDRTWTCQGSAKVGDDVITCSGVHGEEDFAAALANSCNVAFAQIADELGASTLELYTKKAGLTSSYSIDGLPTAKGTFDFSGITENQLGWAGVGQYHDQVNPCALMVYMGAIASGGKAAVPYLIQKTVSSLGLRSLPHLTRQTGTLIEPATAAKLADLMANNVAVTYGKERFPHMDLCAKSGTAEVGTGQAPHAWFAGFLRGSDTPYAFVVLVENGGGGAAVAGTVASKVLDPIVNGYSK
jgi:peptidoglycan glycosyltransferase